MFKFITFFAFLSVAYAGVLEAVARPVLAKHVEEYDPHPQYNFAYEVHDALTGDSKSQVESRDGDVVQGQYWLIDADGYKRIVDYTSDAINGFNAIVRREPLGISSHAAAPALVKSGPIAVAAAPTIAAPHLTYSAPALIKSAPIATYSSAPTYLQNGAALAASSYAAPALYAQSAYAQPAGYAQTAYSAPAVYGSHRLINAAAPTALIPRGSYASSVGSFAAAEPSFHSNLHGSHLTSSGILKTAYVH